MRLLEQEAAGPRHHADTHRSQEAREFARHIACYDFLAGP
jgi:hypothetical protein